MQKAIMKATSSPFSTRSGISSTCSSAKPVSRKTKLASEMMGRSGSLPKASGVGSKRMPATCGKRASMRSLAAAAIAESTSDASAVSARGSTKSASKMRDANPRGQAHVCDLQLGRTRALVLRVQQNQRKEPALEFEVALERLEVGLLEASEEVGVGDEGSHQITHILLHALRKRLARSHQRAAEVRLERVDASAEAEPHDEFLGDGLDVRRGAAPDRGVAEQLDEGGAAGRVQAQRWQRETVLARRPREHDRRLAVHQIVLRVPAAEEQAAHLAPVRLQRAELAADVSHVLALDPRVREQDLVAQVHAVRQDVGGRVARRGQQL
mmetsp:Transcript_27966/g.68973  ORF Transcript_27966/g.68973 Transcript_27966/m.68973 type:complete len:325 (-) Transcript_27966:20-994(-)